MADYEIINGRVVPNKPTLKKKVREEKKSAIDTENLLKGETNAATHTAIPPAQHGNLGKTPGDLTALTGVYDLVARLRDTFKPEYYGGINSIPGAPTLMGLGSQYGVMGMDPGRYLHENLRQAFVNQKTEAQKGTQTEGDIQRLWSEMPPPSGTSDIAESIINRNVGRTAASGRGVYGALSKLGGYDTPGLVEAGQGVPVVSRMMNDAYDYTGEKWGEKYPPTYGPVEVSNVFHERSVPAKLNAKGKVVAPASSTPDPITTPIMSKLNDEWQAIMWAKQNPNDPNARQILMLHGEK